jgi:hypothetical protein
MRIGKRLALAVAVLLAAPAAAVAQQGADEQVRRDAAALPDRLWEPRPETVTAADPGLPGDGAVWVAPMLAVVLILLASVAAGYAVGLRRPADAREAAAPAQPPEPEPEPVAPPAVHHTDTARETCAITLWQAWGRGQFEVHAQDERGEGQVVARSLPFDVPRGAAIQETGPAGRAHRRLLLHLVAAGWKLEPLGDGPWYERRLSRTADEPGWEVDRALIATRPQGGEAEFVALALDEYGNARVMARSPRFGRRADVPVEETEARAAHEKLLEDLEAHGWHVSATLDGWYGAALARRRRRD